MDPLIGRILFERYEVLRKIGSGGMGAVYVGRQLAVGREVALKVLRADLLSNESVRERFRREAAIIGRLRHPNTIQLIDYGETEDGLAVMVIELLVGMSLSDRLRQHGPLPMADALQIGIEVASSLREAHALGLVHRDLKPANIFLVEVAGKVHAKVLDFGIARMLDEESTRITSTGQVFGTPRYMSPEQGTATAEVDHRADVYSLGLIIFECLVGQPPFVANTSIQYLSAHMSLPPPKLREHLPTAPAELDALIDACLVKDRNLRVQSADEVERTLKRISVGLDSGQLGDMTMPPSPAAPMIGSTTATPPGGLTQPTTGATVSRAPAKGRGALALGGVAFVLLGAVIIGIALAKQQGLIGDDRPVMVGALADASVRAAAAPDAAPPLDATAFAVAVDEPPDAGEPEPPDSGLDPAIAEAAPDAGEAIAETTRRRDKHGRSKKSDKSGASSIVGGGVTGPRAMWIPTAAGDSGPIDAAKRCKTSELAKGEAKLSLKPCPKGCAVIVDGTCAGRTPIVELAVPDGNKNVTVVCGGQVMVDQIARLRPGETTQLSCR